MYSLLFLGLVSFVLTLVLTPLVRNLFNGWGLMDRPDGIRKQHSLSVPRVGGIAIASSYLLAFGFLLLLRPNATSIVKEGLPNIVRLLPAVALIFAIGLVDDLFGLRAPPKFCGQIAASLLAYWAGIHVQAFGGYQFAGWLSLPLTVFWLVLCSNAVNLVDGLDGLAAGVGLVASVTMLLAALSQNNVPLALATVPLVGCLSGFLRYNYNPATIFLGDSGSLLIGFLLGCYGVLWSQKSATILGMTAPLMALALPLLDTGLAIARRFLRSAPIFSGDRGHIHHRLLDRGFSPRKVALILYGTCGLAAICSLLMANQHFEVAVLLAFCVAVWVGIRHLGYAEFRVAGRMLAEGAFRSLLNSQISHDHYEQQLVSANTPEQCWEVIQKACKDFGFCEVQMFLCGHAFGYGHDSDTEGAWIIHVRLSETDGIELTRRAEETANSAIVAPFANMLCRTLAPKLPFFILRRPADQARSHAAQAAAASN